MKLRRPEERDLGRIAHMIMKWNRELPEEVRFFEGTPQQAETAATQMINNSMFVGKVADVGGELAGAYAIAIQQGVFWEKPYGKLFCWYVYPQYRGPRMIGFKMLMDAIKMAKEMGLGYFEVIPWGNDEGAKQVLRRLRFQPTSLAYVKRI